MYTNLYLPKKCLNSMALWTALSRRRRKIPAINNPTAGLLHLTQELGKTKNQPKNGLLCLTQELGKTKKTTQTLGCYIWPRGWVTQKLPKYWKNNPKKCPKRLNPAFGLKK